ncbi:probable glycosyltransferase at5g11130 [Phtheirospermum japonicum]|uniref:Probable glycosyltransferase at5g11130 n=1 Tax=Phtheirospermum japonicum TaxID=374723 RepID=A0A830D316_9LAMI|nr:probable glycosyltransferase at5g11130 [Phtheirospermum japonicum]
MAATTAVFSLFLILIPIPIPSLSAAPSSPYLSTATLFRNYQNMLTSFRIFIYSPTKPFNFPDGPSSLFYSSLLNSQFLTQNPNEAHLFFVPFSPDTSTHSLARVVRELRNDHPYWNRTLGADHFFLSPAGIDYSSDRNILELKKNSVQISVFPVISGYFVPHKDITLPPSSKFKIGDRVEENSTRISFLGYLNWDGKTESNLVNELMADVDFLVEEKPEPSINTRSVKKSKFCLFFYHGDAPPLMVEAMSLGCVPVVIVDRPIQDFPLMDVLRWSEIGLLVKLPLAYASFESPTSGGVKRLKEVLGGVSEEKYAEMTGLCVAASKHLVWNEEPQPLDAFHMVMYQLWLKRHAVRYARREFV